MEKSNNLRSSVYLSITAIIWGIAFVFQSMGNDSMGAFTFTASRYFLGFLFLLPILLIKYYHPRFLADSDEIPLKKIPKRFTVVGGVLCGLALGTATIFQQYGLKNTSVGKAGFITTLYIILTPILGLLLGRKCRFTVWIGAFAAILGMYLLCVKDGFYIESGDLLVFICAIFFSVHIMIIDSFAPKTNGVLLSCIQFLISSVFCGVIAFIVEQPSFEQLQNALIPILYTGIMSSGVAYTMQILGQRNFNPTVAAMIMSFESVISAVAGYFAWKWNFLTQDQSLNLLQIIGCVIVFGAVIFVQLPIGKIKRHED